MSSTAPPGFAVRAGQHAACRDLGMPRRAGRSRRRRRRVAEVWGSPRRRRRGSTAGGIGGAELIEATPLHHLSSSRSSFEGGVVLEDEPRHRTHGQLGRGTPDAGSFPAQSGAQTGGRGIRGGMTSRADDMIATVDDCARCSARCWRDWDVPAAGSTGPAGDARATLRRGLPRCWPPGRSFRPLALAVAPGAPGEN